MIGIPKLLKKYIERLRKVPTTDTLQITQWAYNFSLDDRVYLENKELDEVLYELTGSMTIMLSSRRKRLSKGCC